MFIETICLSQKIFLFCCLFNQRFSAEKFPVKIEVQKNHLLNHLEEQNYRSEIPVLEITLHISCVKM